MMNRFVQFRTIGRGRGCDLVLDRKGVAEVHARAALRTDGALWLLAHEGGLGLNRGGDWIVANRLWLCARDRVRLGEVELEAEDICALFGLNAQQASCRPGLEIRVPGLADLQPLAVPFEHLDQLRRNPDTGQPEHQGKVSP